MLKLMKPAFCCCLFFLVHICRAQTNTLSVSEKLSSFSLFTSSSVAAICTDDTDAKVVSIAANAFANDVQLISGGQMSVLHTIPAKGFVIVAGTIGQFVSPGSGLSRPRELVHIFCTLPHGRSHTT